MVGKALAQARDAEWEAEELPEGVRSTDGILRSGLMEPTPSHLRFSVTERLTGRWP